MEGTDFINKCIARRPEARLGLNNSAELKTHVWLKEFEWRKLSRKELISPFKPYKDPKTPLSVLKSQLKHTDNIHLINVQDEARL